MIPDIAAITILLAFAFTFTNGFQDASSIAATLIASRSATPRKGIILVAVMAFLGAVLGGNAVAFTLSGLITLESGSQTIVVLLAAVLSATAWNLATWSYGLPSSSTHALIGGLIGAGIAAAGTGSVYWGVADLLAPSHEMVGLVKILFFFVASIFIGFAGSYLMRRTTGLLLRNAKKTVNRTIVRLNRIAAAAMAFFNGANDSQKQLGIIALALFAADRSATLDVPLWARFACAVLLGVGTLGGGWRIMNTLGRRIFEIEPIHSFDSQVSSGAAIALSTLAGAPISSTHIITTSVIGLGAAENPRRVHWQVGKEIVAAMVVTIPGTALVGALVYLIVSLLTGA
ncbi:MAG: inorganic phosphate transporter, PiT family [Methanofollis sp.]|nr:inorganic phosphate transporter, PiT family [Methanofollis sp.]